MKVSQPSGSTIKNGLTASEVLALAEWFRDSYESGWRPNIWPPTRVAALHAKLDALYESATGPRSADKGW